MKLEDLYPNFAKQTVEAQEEFIIAYRLKRMKDLETIQQAVKKNAGKCSMIELSDEEKAIMKMLGLKPKDLTALRAMETTQSNGDEEQDDVSLVSESFDEEEDG